MFHSSPALEFSAVSFPSRELVSDGKRVELQDQWLVNISVFTPFRKDRLERGRQVVLPCANPNRISRKVA
jgi:hypothetical protein